MPEPGKSVTTTAGDIGKALVDRKFVAQPGVVQGPGSAQGTVGNTTYVGANGLTGLGDLEGVSARSPNAVRQISTVHEAMHGAGTDISRALRNNMDLAPWNAAHQTPFNQAAKDLLEP